MANHRPTDSNTDPTARTVNLAWRRPARNTSGSGTVTTRLTVLIAFLHDRQQHDLAIAAENIAALVAAGGHP